VSKNHKSEIIPAYRQAGMINHTCLPAGRYDFRFMIYDFSTPSKKKNALVSFTKAFFFVLKITFPKINRHYSRHY